MKKENKLKKVLLTALISAAAFAVTVILVACSGTIQKKPVSIAKETQELTKETNETQNTTETETETEKKPEELTNPKNAEDAKSIEASAKKRVYLSFDDGPSGNTEKILDILDKYDIKATFFDVEKTDEAEIKALKRTYDDGHTIAVHTMTHDYDTVYKSFENWKADVLGEQEYIEKHTGVKSFYYRFPGGSSNTIAAKRGTDIVDCIHWLNDNGWKYYDWNIDNEDSDGKSHTASDLASNVLDYIGDEGDYMILMHDTNAKGTTVESLPQIIEALKAKGYTFCQITENTKLFQHLKADSV